MKGIKNFYFAASVEENNKWRAFVVKANIMVNLKSLFQNLTHVNICETKKEAERIVEKWNEEYKRSGRYAEY